MSKAIRVVLADDHALVLEGLRSLLAHEADILVIATATDGERLLDAVQRFSPDVVVVDVRMPYLDGIACLERIRAAHTHTRVLLITAFDDPDTLRAVMMAGPDGLLLKCDPPEQVAAAIRQVMAGQLVFPAAARSSLRTPATQAPDIQLSARVGCVGAGGRGAQQHRDHTPIAHQRQHREIPPAKHLSKPRRFQIAPKPAAGTSAGSTPVRTPGSNFSAPFDLRPKLIVEGRRLTYIFDPNVPCPRLLGAYW